MKWLFCTCALWPCLSGSDKPLGLIKLLMSNDCCFHDRSCQLVWNCNWIKHWSKEFHSHYNVTRSKVSNTGNRSWHSERLVRLYVTDCSLVYILTNKTSFTTTCPKYLCNESSMYQCDEPNLAQDGQLPSFMMKKLIMKPKNVGWILVRHVWLTYWLTVSTCPDYRALLSIVS